MFNIIELIKQANWEEKFLKNQKNREKSEWMNEWMNFSNSK